MTGKALVRKVVPGPVTEWGDSITIHLAFRKVDLSDEAKLALRAEATS